MNKNELNIRVLATIRTDLHAKRMALKGILQEHYEGNEELDYVLEHNLNEAIIDLNSTITALNYAIDRMNELKDVSNN